MKLNKSKILDKLKKVLIIFLLYLFVFNIIPFILPKDVSDEFTNSLGKENTIKAGQDRVALVEDHVDAFNARLAMIQNSRSSIDIVYHTIQDGKSTDALFLELYQAAERGVEVRILIDGKVGSINREVALQLKELSAHENISVGKYNPANILKPWEFQALLHDKFIIVDNEYLLLGGRNLGDKYFKPQGYEGKFADDRDIFVYNTKDTMDGSVLSQVSKYADSLWESKNIKLVKSKNNPNLKEELQVTADIFYEENPDFIQYKIGDYVERCLETTNIYMIHNPINNGKKEPWVAYQLQQLAYEATDNILIQTPYSTANKKLLSTYDSISDTLNIDIVTNSPASTPNYPAFSNYYSQRKKFLNSGVNLYEYQSTDSIHGKSFIYDNKISAVGSFNLDDRSIYLSTESMIIVESEEFATQLADAIGSFKEQSLQVGKDNNYIYNQNIKEVQASNIKLAMLWFVSIFSRLFQFLI